MDKDHPADSTETIVEPHGPRRRAPQYYAGETLGRRRIQYPDVARYPMSYPPALRGKVASKRDKQARRLIRGALKRTFSKIEREMKLPRAMQAQARELIRDAPSRRTDSSGVTAWIGKSPRAARRLYASELAIHEPVYVPENLRAFRTEKRKLKRQGKLDAIGQLVDRMSKP